MSRRIGIVSSEILSIPNLKSFLERDGDKIVPLARTTDRGIDCLAGFGSGSESDEVRLFCAFHRIPYICVDHGFFGCRNGALASPASLTVERIDDDYFFPHRAIELEIIEGRPLSDRERTRALTIMDRIREMRISVHHHCLDCGSAEAALDDLPERFVLAADQVADAHELRTAAPASRHFARMLSAAAVEAKQRGLQVVVKADPRETLGSGKSVLWSNAKNAHANIAELVSMFHGVTVIRCAASVNSYDLFDRSESVHVVSSRLGFDALIAGKPVYAYARAFFSGRGLTHDAFPSIGPRSDVASIFTAACLRHSRYVDTGSGEPCDLEHVLDRINRDCDVRLQSNAA